jgi:UDP:flavonoid glycosyltransferase YjiC (YdhE family)
VRALLTCHDAGGTVPPVLGLAQALRARGHEAVVLSQPSVRARAEGLGCRFTALSAVPDYVRRRAIEEQLEISLPALTGREVGEDVLGLAGDGVDLVVVDANLAGGLAAAESLPQPSVVLLHSMYAAFVRTWFSHLWPLLGDVVNGTRAHFGLAPVGDWASLFRAHDRLLAVVPEGLDAPVPEVPANLRHFGFLLPEPPPGAGAPAFPDGDGPAVLVGLSTTYQAQEALLQSVLDALGLVGARAIVTTSGQVDAGDLRVPAAVRVEESVPHTLVLPQADVMVTHAGLGSVAAALGAGVPLVCTPIDRDQPLNAEQVVAAGAGVAVAPTASPEVLAAAIGAVAGDPAHRRAAEAVAAASRAAGGPAAAVADLESLVG